jgi:hypothetical protein
MPSPRTPAIYQKLADLVAQIEDAFARGHTAAVLDGDRLFHATLVAAANSPRLPFQVYILTRSSLAEPGTWPGPPVTTITQTTRYGTAVACSWDRLHPRLTGRAAWQEHDGELPVIEGTLIRLAVDHLPGDRNPKPVWLWWSATGAVPADIDRCWQAFLRRFDIEQTFRLFKQVLGWTAPAIRGAAAADRWTWLIIACHAQLRLARVLAAGLRRPWEKPAPPGKLTPARVRRGFRNIRATTACPAGAPKPGKLGCPAATAVDRTVLRPICGTTQSRQNHTGTAAHHAAPPSHVPRVANRDW